MTNENEIIDVEIDETSDMDDTEMDNGDEVRGQDDDEGDEVRHGEIVSAEEAERALTVNGNSAESFYASLGSEIASELRSAAEDAKTKMYNAQNNAIEAGRILNRARDLLAHGQFSKWLSIEFAGTDRTARNLMSYATSADTALKLFGPEAESKILALPQTVAYKLGSELLSDDDRNEIIEALDRGEYSDADEVKEAINERKAEARKKREGEKLASGKGSKGDGEGEGEGDRETFAEKKKKYTEAVHRDAAFRLAVGLVVSEDDGGGDAASDVVSRYGEIGSGSKGKMTAEDHAMTSEMIFKVAQAYAKGGMDAVNKLKPSIPDAPVAKSKKTKKADGGDD